MSKCLVTGGAGFIGSHVAKELLSEENNVYILDDLSGGFIDNIPSGGEFIKGSILNHELINNIIESNKIDYIFHLAAYAAEGLSHFIKRFNYNNNLIGSVNLINAAINYKVKCFVFTSSIAVYGTGQVPMTEEMAPVPEDSYGISKYAVELDLMESYKMFGLNYIIFRPHNVYGDNQNIGDKYRNVIGIFINQIMQGMPLTIFGDGSQTRAFSYIKDVAPVIAKSINIPKAYNNVFNVGADIPYSVKHLAEIVSKCMGVKQSINYLEKRNEVLHAFSTHEKVENIFGYKSKYSLEEGISNMVTWAKTIGPRKSKPFGEIEIYKNLPKSWLEAIEK
jgi:UDP-glucose 4-epimerase